MLIIELLQTLKHKSEAINSFFQTHFWFRFLCVCDAFFVKIKFLCVFRTLYAFICVYGQLYKKYFHLKLMSILMVALCIVTNTLKIIYS